MCYVMSVACKKKGALGLWNKKKRKHDFGLLAFESRGQRVMLALFCHSEGCLGAAGLIKDQSHVLIGRGGWQGHLQFTVTFTLRTTGAATSLEALHS